MTLRIVVALSALLSIAYPTTAEAVEVLRHRLLEAKPQSLRGATSIGDPLPLRLFDDTQFTARLVGLEDSPLNGYVWRGVLENVPGGWAVLVDNQGCMAGTVATGDSFFRILCLGGRTHVIEEVRPPKDFLDDASETAGDLPLDTFELEPATLEPGETAEMDLLVVYSRKAAKDFFRRYDLGDRFSNKNRAIKAYIQLAVAVANTAFLNSEVDIHLRLVKARPIGYRGEVDSSRDLANLRHPDDGVIDKVHRWRDQYGADFVSLVVKEFEEGIGGRAYLVPPSPDAAERLFSVVEYDNLWSFTLAHEIGHNMGLAHDRDNDSTSPFAKAYRYSHGYQDPVGGFVTVMAYFEGCEECLWRIPHFSNRRVTWQGAPTGLPMYQAFCGAGVTSGPRCGRRTGKGNADCARSLNNTREFYAAVLPCKVRCGG